MACSVGARTPVLVWSEQDCGQALDCILRCLQAICLILVAEAPVDGLSEPHFTAHYSIRASKRARVLVHHRTTRDNHGIRPTGMLPASLAPTIPLSMPAGVRTRASVRQSRSYQKSKCPLSLALEGVGLRPPDCELRGPSVSSEGDISLPITVGSALEILHRNAACLHAIVLRLGTVWDNMAPSRLCIRRYAPVTRHMNEAISPSLVSDHKVIHSSLAQSGPAGIALALAHRSAVALSASSLARALSAHYPRIHRGQQEPTGWLQGTRRPAPNGTRRYGSRGTVHGTRHTRPAAHG